MMGHMVTLRFKKLSPDAKAPSYSHPGDAGMDLYASQEVKIARGGIARIATGLAMEIPDGYAGLVWDKSGLSTAHGIKTLAGVIDSGYRGEIQVGLINLGNEDVVIAKHQKVAQLLIQKVERADFEETDMLNDTSRGAGGFGSTGKH